MGVKKPGYYSLTNHAKDRFLERFRLDEEEALSLTRRRLESCVFAGNQKDNCERWIDLKSGIVFIINPSSRSVITVYRIESEYEPDINQELSNMMIESINTFRNQKLREFGLCTTDYYRQLGELTDKLSRTAQPKMMEKTLAEIKQIRKDLNQVISHHQELMISINLEISRLSKEEKI